MQQKRIVYSSESLRLLNVFLQRCLSVAALCLVFISIYHGAYAQTIMVGPDKKTAVKELAVPYAFYNSSFGAAAGFVYGATGWPQKQATLLATVIGGSSSAFAFYMISRDFQIPLGERFFMDTDIALSTFGNLTSFSNGNPLYRNEQAGSNDSSKNNYIRGSGDDNLAKIKFRYILPIGGAKDQAINTLVLDKGLPIEGMAGGYSWNPLVSGKTSLEVKPFWRNQTVDSTFRFARQNTNGVEFSAFRDNTDFPQNPSVGSSLRLRYTKDWGNFDSSNPYSVMDAEFSKYIPLGATENFRQRVLAFDFWTADTPSYNDYNIKNGERVFQRSPAFVGATLGGLWRLRGYPTQRFHDKAAIFYALEYRMTPKWNPFANIEWVDKHLGITTWQIVPFVEVGRVAPSWNLDTLHTKMQWDAGIGIRAMAKGLMVRIDTAVGNGSYGVSMMVGHPFQF